jgi:hypothetical protein
MLEKTVEKCSKHPDTFFQERETFSRGRSKHITVKPGFNEFGCERTLGYNEQIFKSNWSFYYTN